MGDEGSNSHVFVSPILEKQDFKNIQELFWRPVRKYIQNHLEPVRIINDPYRVPIRFWTAFDIAAMSRFHQIAFKRTGIYIQ